MLHQLTSGSQVNKQITVVGFVCGSGSIFQIEMSQPRRPTDCCDCLIYNVLFFVKQPLHEDTEFEWQPY